MDDPTPSLGMLSERLGYFGGSPEKFLYELGKSGKEATLGTLQFLTFTGVVGWFDDVSNGIKAVFEIAYNLIKGLKT